MELVVICDTSNRFASMCVAASKASHRRHIPAIDKSFHVDMAQPERVSLAVRVALMNNSLGDHFILTTDTTFITAPFDIGVLRQREKFALRKGQSTEAMVKTIGYLLDNGLPTFDYELDVPLIVNRKMAEQALAVEGSDDMHFRTLYCNMWFNGGERTPDPYIDIWTHNMDPAGPVVSLGQTAIRHQQCKKWITRLLEDAPIPA